TGLEYENLNNGTVTFTLYWPVDETCSQPPADVQTFPWDGEKSIQSDFVQFNTGGTWRWVVSFSATSTPFEQPQPSFLVTDETECDDPTQALVVNYGDDAVDPDIETPEPDGDGDGDEHSDDGDGGKSNHRSAALPNVGASEHLNLIGGTGIALTLAGLTIVAATRRRGGAPLS
ncbi:MAG: hypothetical protein ABIO14_09300, partial [Aeromicrobium sp.]